jgi:hypothetical protein
MLSQSPAISGHPPPRIQYPPASEHTYLLLPSLANKNINCYRILDRHQHTDALDMYIRVSSRQGRRSRALVATCCGNLISEHVRNQPQRTNRAIKSSRSYEMQIEPGSRVNSVVSVLECARFMWRYFRYFVPRSPDLTAISCPTDGWVIHNSTLACSSPSTVGRVSSSTCRCQTDSLPDSHAS